jgi:hypothetical protein
MSVTVPYPVPADLHAALFAELGTLPRIARDTDRSTDQVPEYVVVVTLVAPFFSGLLERLGAEAWSGIRRVFARLRRPHEDAPAYEIRLDDSESGVTVVIDEGAWNTDKALTQLSQLSLGAFRRDTVLVWNPTSNTWLPMN